MKKDTSAKELKHIRIVSSPWREEKEDDCGQCQTSCQSACKTSCTVGNVVCDRKRIR
jgi:predicted ribosomally synthesized six-cysteine peptide SCIFF